MKRLVPVLSLCLLAAITSSCDFIRSLAGRPTSAELKELSLKETPCVPCEMPAADVEPAQVCTPAASCEGCAADKAPEYELKKRKGRLTVPFAYTHTSGQISSKLSHKYYIVVGTYRERPTRDRMVASVKKAGYDVTLIKFTNGLVSVALLPCDNLALAIDNFATVAQEKFTPKDACILIAQ